MDIEVCISSIEEAMLASRMGAKRVELCSALEVGGLTPGAGMIEACAKINGPEVHVLVRPRAGNFIYSEAEQDIMKLDIEVAAGNGATGVVFGVLTPNSDVDEDANKQLLDLTQSLNLETTFHRAIDVTTDPVKALLAVINLGFQRVLTSGQKERAIDGIELIRRFVGEAGDQIQIMAGSGVSAENAGELANTGVDALHFSSRKKRSEEVLGMGAVFEPDEEKITEILKALKR